MANLFDYIRWRGDLDFAKSELNPVDYLIFSQIAYLPFDGIVPGPKENYGISLSLALEILLENLHSAKPGEEPVLGFKEDPDFINALVSSSRFRDCYLLGYVNQIDEHKEIQFSAICIYTGFGTSAIAFRGTDASFIGWKEDFNMAFLDAVPAQQEAVKYVDRIAPLLEGSLQIAGHSKGGNLAVYAASFCNPKIQSRITDVYSYDAPGFNEKIIASAAFNNIKENIHSFIPQASVIGMMLERGSNYSVIKSSGTGLMQHFLFSWQVTHNDMVYADKLNLSSTYVDKTIRQWIGKLDNSQREEFIEGLYKILRSSEIKSVHDMEKSWMFSLSRIIKSLGKIDDTTRKKTLKTIAALFRSAGRNLEIFFKKQ